MHSSSGTPSERAVLDATADVLSWVVMLNWSQIDTVFLDMDGTLLDLHFDDFFWLEYVPSRYAQEHGMEVEEARTSLLNRYRKIEGTLDWYSVDFWSNELGMDIPVLKQEVAHLIAVFPHVEEFLARVREIGRRLVLVTNAHGKSLSIKMRRTKLGKLLDAIVCAHDLGLPKEDAEFWARLRAVEQYEPSRTLLVDDNLAVLRSAAAYGIAHLITIRQPNRRRPARTVGEFAAISDFREICPSLPD